MELETFFTASQQTQLFLLSCLLGIPIGILFDVFRTIRIILPHNKVLVAIEDILFMFIYSAFVMSFSIVAARGVFRFYYILGNLLGFAVYFFTAGNVIIRALKTIFSFISKIIKILLSPFMKLNTSICEKFKDFLLKNSKKINLIIKKQNRLD